MKKLSKIIVLILSLAILCGALAFAVSANGEEPYSIDDAIKAAVADESGMKTVKLVGDACLDAPCVLDSNLTIDLGGYTFTSEHKSAFIIDDENIKFSVVGSGKLKLDGMIVSASKTAIGANITIGSDDGEIEIYHSGESAPQIFSAYSGTSVFKNFKALSDYEIIAGNAKYSATFETPYNTEHSVNMTFEGVEIHRPLYHTEKTFFVISVAGDGSHLTVKDSAIHTQGSGIFLGEANAVKEVEVPDAKEGEPTTKLEPDPTGEVLNFENSFLRCVADSEKGQKWGFCLEGYNYNQKDMAGVMNIKDSFIEVAGRPFYTHHTGNPTSTFNLINTEARCIANNGSDGSEFFARHVTMYVDKDSRILAFSGGNKINFNNLSKVHVSVGTRVSNTSYVTSTTEGVTYPDNSIGVSKDYVWVYDPAGDPVYPYVLVEKASAPTTNLPYYKVTYDFDLMRSNAEEDDKGYVVYLAKTPSNYTDLDGSFDADKGMEFNIKMGSLYRGYSIGNSYGKFVISNHAHSQEAVNTVSSDGKTLTSTGNPYFILGAHRDYSKNKAHFDTTGGNTRAKVAVLNFDFGTDSEIGYPVLRVETQSRRTAKWTNVWVNAFKIDTDGTITNLQMEEFKSVTLNDVGEWNHMTVVFYTDPALKNSSGTVVGRAYYYLNGEYFGYTDAASNGNDAYVMGVRFNSDGGVVQPIDAAICFDNVSFSAYNNYVFTEEADGTGDALGTYSPEKYVTAAPARKFINVVYSVGGVPQTEDINDALEHSAVAGKPLVLENNIYSPQRVTTNGTIITNGYDIEIANGSTSCVVTYDENGKPAKLVFNDTYDALKVNYYWYTGKLGNLTEMRNPDNYDKTAITIGVVPTPLKAPYDIIVDVNGNFKKFIGWSTSSDATEPEELVPVTISQAINNGDEPVYLYPVYVDTDPIICNAYVTNKAGVVVGTSKNDNETKALYKALKDGETLVLCADFTLNDGSALFDNHDIDTGVEIDNDYTSSELEAMKEKSAKLAVNVNGYKWTLSVTGKVASVSRNTTLNIYSSRPGGYIYSRGKEDTKLLSQRMFAIFGGLEEPGEKLKVYNAHINIGTVTVDGNTYSGSNLALNGGVILEGMVGDNSCSIVADGILAMRGINCSSGMIMTRYYDGEIIVKNSIFLAPNTAEIIDLYNYDVSGNPNNGRQTFDDGSEIPVMTPYVLLENSLFVNKNTDGTAANAQNLVKCNGDYKENVCLEYKNFITNGNINPVRGDRNFIGGGVASQKFSAGVNDPYQKAQYRRAMTLNMKDTFAGGNDTHIVAVQSPTLLDDGSINDNRYFYVVDPGYEHLIPTDAAGYVVLPKVLDRMTCTDGTLYEVYIYDFIGNKSPLKKCASGANPIGMFDISDITVGSLTLTHDGTYTLTAEDGTTHTVDITTGITASGDLRPNYKATANLDGFKTSLSLHADFGVNLYVPKAYADIITEVTSPAADGKLAGVEKNYEGADYTVYTVYVPVGKSADDVVFDIFVSDSSNSTLGTVIGTCTQKIKIAEYCETVLKNEAAKYTAEDREMTWYAVNYANEAYKYFGGAENSSFASLLAAYADAKGEAVERVYKDSLTETGLSAVFDYVTLKLVEVPEPVFILKAGFEGTVTVTTSEGAYSFTVEASEEAAKLEITGMKAYELAETVTVTAEGKIGTESVKVEGGKFNIATFAAYHTANAAENEASAKALDVIGALYDYVNAAQKYNAPAHTES